mmetsp:Transcript_16554/g.39825  ORF Transcript_16554/g.39825 Transcript_16554/m.39825 type:complete len:229 (-) Transcript_16554:324-1010(-)
MGGLFPPASLLPDGSRALPCAAQERCAPQATRERRPPLPQAQVSSAWVLGEQPALPSPLRKALSPTRGAAAGAWLPVRDQHQHLAELLPQTHAIQAAVRALSPGEAKRALPPRPGTSQLGHRPAQREAEGEDGGGEECGAGQAFLRVVHFLSRPPEESAPPLGRLPRQTQQRVRRRRIEGRRGAGPKPRRVATTPAFEAQPRQTQACSAEEAGGQRPNPPRTKRPCPC